MMACMCPFAVTTPGVADTVMHTSLLVYHHAHDKGECERDGPLCPRPKSQTASESENRPRPFIAPAVISGTRNTECTSLRLEK
jgi:hypothetical protein